MEDSLTKEIRQILGHYDIGELAEYKRIPRGYVNVSYMVDTVDDGEKNRYFLRKYKKGITEEELTFEHSLIKHLVDEGLDLVAKVIPTKAGGTYVKRDREAGVGEGPPTFYAVFEWMRGEDRYTWDNPALNDEELRSAASALAQFHASTYGFEPSGKRTEPKISALLPMLAEEVEAFLEEAGDTVFDDYFLEHADLVRDEFDRTMRGMEEKGCKDQIALVIHCDYAAGNLKFEGDEVIGVYDFDWSKVDVRCFEVGHALMYLCSCWDPEHNGEFRPRRASVFLDGYQSTLDGQHELEPLTEGELECLPYMVSAANLYILHWALADFYGKDVDPEEYRRYLAHHVGLINWLRDKANWDRLTDLVAEAAR